jgi:hypothetical protein
MNDGRVICGKPAEMTLYDPDGAVLARADLTPGGWLIAGRDGGQPYLVPPGTDARQALLEWSPKTAARQGVRRAADAWRAARKDLEAAMGRALEQGVSVTALSRDSGFSRQRLYQILPPELLPQARGRT